MPTLPLHLPIHPSPLFHLAALAHATLPVAHPPIMAPAIPLSAMCDAHCATQIHEINHKQEVLHNGPMCDLLWSNLDGVRHCLTHHTSHITCPLTYCTEIQGWELLPHGMEYLFSADITKRFVYENDIDLIAYMH